MNKLVIILSFLLCVQTSLPAQSKKKSEKEFLHFLNAVLKASPQQHSAYDNFRMTIDSPFVIDKNGMLSVSVRYHTDTSFFRARTEAPLFEIESVLKDVYLLLRFKGNAVLRYVSDHNSENLIQVSPWDLFQIGHINDDEKVAVKAQKLWQALQKYYQPQHQILR